LVAPGQKQSRTLKQKDPKSARRSSVRETSSEDRTQVIHLEHACDTRKKYLVSVQPIRRQKLRYSFRQFASPGEAGHVQAANEGGEGGHFPRPNEIPHMRERGILNLQKENSRGTACIFSLGDPAALQEKDLPRGRGKVCGKKTRLKYNDRHLQ